MQNTNTDAPTFQDNCRAKPRCDFKSEQQDTLLAWRKKLSHLNPTESSETVGETTPPQLSQAEITTKSVQV